MGKAIGKLESVNNAKEDIEEFKKVRQFRTITCTLASW